MWKYKGDELGLEGIIGVPNQDMTDEEFAEASAKVNSWHPDQPGSLALCGLWTYIDDKPVARRTREESI